MNPESVAGPSIAGTMEREDWFCLAGLLLLLFATRLVWILWNPDATLYWEEDYRWIAARELLAGPRQPIFDYQADNYQGGSLVMIGLITGLFAVFGESLLSLKLAPLAFAGATLAAIYFLSRLWFGRRTALLATSGYLVGPPLLAHAALIPMGSHAESALFSLLQLICFLGILSRRWHTPLGWAALGSVTGLGLWFCYTSGISLVACGITWLIFEGLPKPQFLLAAAGGAMLGLTPWWIYNFQNDFTGFLRLLEVFGAGNPIDAWAAQGPLAKFMSLFFRDLPIGMLDPFADLRKLVSPLFATSLEVGFYLPVTIALAAGFNRAVHLGLSMGMGIDVLRTHRTGQKKMSAKSEIESQRSEFVFFVYVLVFLAAYLSSSFTLEPEKGAHAYRLFLPLAILMWIPVANSLSRAIDDRGIGKYIGIIGIAFILISCSVSSVALAMRNPEERHLGSDRMEHVHRGYLVRGVLLHRKYEKNLLVAFSQARRVSNLQERFRVFQGIGWGIEFRYEGSGQITSLRSDLSGLPLGERVAVLSGLLWTAGNRVTQLQETVANTEATPRNREQLARLIKLKVTLQKRWQRLPVRYQQSDTLLY